MKLGAIVPVLNEWRFLPAVLGQLLGVCDRVLLLRGTRSLSGAPAELTAMPAIDPRVEVLTGAWPSEHETRNAGMDHLSDCDYVLTIDSDEIFLPDGFESIKRGMATGAKAVMCCLYTYWKTTDYRIDPPENLIAAVAVRKDTRFAYLRRPDAGPQESCLVQRHIMHHLSYVRTDEEMLEKLRLFGHAAEIQPGWYDKVWRPWDKNPSMMNLHPTTPRAYKRAIKVDSAELKAELARFGVT